MKNGRILRIVLLSRFPGCYFIACSMVPFDISSWVIIIFHNGLMDAALDEGAGGDDFTLPILRQNAHALCSGLGKEKAR